MPSNNPTNVSLDVRNSSSNGGGWVNVNAANGAPYSYLYTGGNHGNNGNISYGVGNGNAAITLTFASSTDPRYSFVGNNAITFQGDPDGQLSTHGNASRTREINDSCSGELTATYKVLVTDSTANTTIQCDPEIRNVPSK